MIVDARAFSVSKRSVPVQRCDQCGGRQGSFDTLIPMKSRTRHASRMPMQGVSMLHTLRRIRHALFMPGCSGLECDVSST